MRSRFVPDRFILLLLGAVLLGWLLPVRENVLYWARQISSISIFMLFFLHGLRLPRGEILTAARSWKVQAAMLLFSFFVMPLAGIILIKATGSVLPAALASGLLFCVMLPSTVQSAISYASIAGGNVAASAVGAAISNLAGIIVTPVLVALVIGMVPGITLNSDTIIRITILLLLPFALGQGVQGWLGEWARRQKAMLAFFDRLVILIAVYVAFAAAVSSGSLALLNGSTLAVLALLTLTLLAFAFGGAWGLGAAIGLSRADRISLLFAGAHKSIATGAPMAAILFGHSAGLIVLPAILYHMAQLIVSAPLAGRLAR